MNKGFFRFLAIAILSISYADADQCKVENVKDNTLKIVCESPCSFSRGDLFASGVLGSLRHGEIRLVNGCGLVGKIKSGQFEARELVQVGAPREIGKLIQANREFRIEKEKERQWAEAERKAQARLKAIEDSIRQEEERKEEERRLTEKIRKDELKASRKEIFRSAMAKGYLLQNEECSDLLDCEKPEKDFYLTLPQKVYGYRNDLGYNKQSCYAYSQHCQILGGRLANRDEIKKAAEFKGKIINTGLHGKICLSEFELLPIKLGSESWDESQRILPFSEEDEISRELTGMCRVDQMSEGVLNTAQPVNLDLAGKAFLIDFVTKPNNVSLDLMYSKLGIGSSYLKFPHLFPTGSDINIRIVAEKFHPERGFYKVTKDTTVKIELSRDWEMEQKSLAKGLVSLFPFRLPLNPTAQLLFWLYRHLCGSISRPPQWNRIAVL